MNNLKDKSVNLIAVDRLSSTNTVLKSIYNIVSDNTVLLADSQTAGRGRLNKNFYSPNNTGVYLSLLSKRKYTKDDALLITPLVAVAVLDVIKRYAENVKIKWVNDIYIDDRKVCGILTESSFDLKTNLTDYVIIGIGLNVFKPIDGFPSDISNIATSIFDDKDDCDINLIVAELINSINYYLSRFDINKIITEYTDNSYLDGKKVKFIELGHCYEAEVLGIDDHLRLIVKRNDGEIVTLSSGEVAIITN